MSTFNKGDIMDDSHLNVMEGYLDDCKITQMQYHSFLPYSSTAFSKNDEIRISIQNMDAYTLPCESYLFIERKVNKQDSAVGDIYFTNNGLVFLFSEMRYEVNGVEIQKLNSPGIYSTLKGYCSYAPHDLYELENVDWDLDETNFMEKEKFSGCHPLKHLFEFCEDYKKVLLNCSQQIILNQSSTNFDTLRSTVTKVLWKSPVIRINDSEKLKLLRALDSCKPLECTSLLENPRFVIIGFQTNRKNNLINPSGWFDHCNLKNLKVYLNNEVYPYEGFHANFSKAKTAILCKAYTDFQKSYYGRETSAPLLTRQKFTANAPIVVVDLSRQNDNVRASTVDLRIEF
ncbi:Hypothetical protein CINCED_3A015353 [Cinara cedri]|uniref:Double jelly roll-like domain-containing protein n=1 Tax=Cinara cedri TaxID=506608 RepID=A0A5E4NJY5_9HEMI|nr:Hypothetical protein CINCED_3A015353 [Cinara cedri]